MEGFQILSFDFKVCREKIYNQAIEKKILIAAHRGTYGGNIVQNTIPAYRNALMHRADIIELDAAMTKDGVFFAFHDGQEPLLWGTKENIRTLTSEQVANKITINNIGHKVSQKINTLDEVLNYFKGQNCIINIDRSWFYWREIIDFLKKFDMSEQVVLKSPVKKEYLDSLREIGSHVMYMPIVKTIEELELVRSYEDVNLLGVELIFDSENHPLVASKIFEILSRENILTWVNSISLDDTPNLSACFGDNKSIIEGFDNGWGWLIKKGFTILQTDWPMLLREYVDKL